MQQSSASEHAHQTQVAKLPETWAPVALKLLKRNPILREWRVTHTELDLRPWSDKVILRWARCPGAVTFEPSACLWDLPHLLLGRASHDLVWTSSAKVLSKFCKCWQAYAMCVLHTCMLFPSVLVPNSQAHIPTSALDTASSQRLPAWPSSLDK